MKIGLILTALCAMACGFTVAQSHKPHGGSFHGVTFYGATSLKNLRYTAINIYGASDLTDVDALEANISGAITIQRGTYGIITIKGAITAIGSIITNKATIHGGATFNNCTIHDLTVSGGIDLVNSTVNGATTVNGGVTIKNSTIQDFTTNGRDTECIDSTINGSIYLKPLTTYDNPIGWLFSFFTTDEKQQILTVQNSTIHGDITFEKEGGVVIVKGNSTINGKVINGKVRKE